MFQYSHPLLPPVPALGTGSAARAPLADLGLESSARRNQRLLHAHTSPASGAVAPGGVGLWIDHRKAVIVFVSLAGAYTTLLFSRVDKQPGRIDGFRSTAPFEAQLAPADDRRDRRHAARLALYYDAVISRIRNSQRILAFGPGEAKGELRHRLALDKHDRRDFVFETADKMTGRQIAARTIDWLMAKPAPQPPLRRSGRPKRRAQRTSR